MVLFQSAWAIVGAVFVSTVGKASTIFNMGMTAGLAGGPFIGGVLYKLLGYVGPFYVSGGLCLLYVFIKSFYDMESVIAMSPTKTPRRDTEASTGLVYEVTACHLFHNIVSEPNVEKAVFGLLVYFLSIMCLCFFEPILAD